MSGFDITNVMDFPDPRRVPTLPCRPSWLTEDAINRKANISDAIKHVMDKWKAWADCVEKIFQQMGDQTKDLELSEDEYISFIHMFASHPARPTQRALEDITEHENWFIRTMPHRYLSHLHGLWSAYADKLETTYVGMAAELGRCDLLAFPFETTSTGGQLRGILRSMLGPGRIFQNTRAPGLVTVAGMSLQGPSVTYTEQVVSGIEKMSLYGEPINDMEDAEKLAVGLQNMKIKADSS